MTSKQIVRAINDRREYMHIPLCELAEKAGVSISTISKWISGESSPNLHSLLLVMEAVGMSLVYTMDDKVNPCPGCSSHETCEKRCAVRKSYDINWILEKGLQ